MPFFLGGALAIAVFWLRRGMDETPSFHARKGPRATTWGLIKSHPMQSLTVIESLGTSGGEPERSVERLKDFVTDLFKPVRRRVYSSIDEAGKRVAEANSSYRPAAALHMAKFGTTVVEGGVVFTADPLLKRTSGMTFDEAQVLAILGGVKCPVQIIQGTNGMTLDDETMKKRLAALRNPAVIPIQGGHHVHLDRPADVAAQIVRFIEAL